MKLNLASELTLREAESLLQHLVINEADEGPLWSFAYDNFKIDPQPKILLLGSFKHPNTGNHLVGGININYLDKFQQKQLTKKLPLIMKGSNLYRRYHIGRKVLPDVFDKFYRTYNADYIRGVKQDTLYPRYGYLKTASNWLKNKIKDLRSTKAQRKADDKPDYPDDLRQLNTGIDRTVKDLQKLPDKEPNEIEKRQEVRVAKSLPDPDIKYAEEPEEDPEDAQLRQAIEDQEEEIDFDDIEVSDQDQELLKNKYLSDLEDSKEELGESITYYCPFRRSYITENI